MNFGISACLILILALPIHSKAQNRIYTLQECVAEAQKNSLTIQNAQLSMQTSEVNLKQSQQSRYPSLNANVGQGFQFGRSIDPSTNQFLQQNIVSNNVSLSSNINLFSGFQQNYTIKQNQRILSASTYDVEKIKNDVLLQVTALYLRLTLNKEILGNSLLQAENTNFQLQRMQKMALAGSATELSVAQLQAQQAIDAIQITRAENEVQLSKLALLQAMNVEANKVETFDIEKIDVQEDKLNALVLNTHEISEQAKAVQPQIKSSENRVSSAEMGVKIAQSAYLPRLSIGLNISSFYSSANKLAVFNGLQTTPIGFLAADPSQVVNTTRPNISFNNYPFLQQIKDKFGEQIFFSLNIPLINGRQTLSNVERNKINIQISKNNLRLTENQLRQQIEQAYTDYNTAYKSFLSAKNSYRLNELVYQQAQKRHEAGLMNLTELLVQKNNLNISMVQLAQSKYDCFFKMKVLDFYQGKIN
jgi:outer membrane protein